MTFQQVLSQAKKGQIHGSDALTRSILLAFSEYVRRLNITRKRELIAQLKRSIHQMESLKEPLLTNALKLLTIEGRDADQVKIELGKQIENLIEIIESSRSLIARYGANKVRKGGVIFTHSYSSTVKSILIQAKVNTSFTVATTESHPFLEGRRMAETLADHCIEVNHYLDNAFRPGLKKSEFVLLGCEAITKNGVISRIGAGLIAEVANNHKLPVYIAANSWKYIKTFETQESDFHQIWDKHPLHISSYTEIVDLIPNKHIKGIICEFGILSPKDFLKRIKKEYPFLT